MSDHVWAQENIAAYIAGGLDPAEGERLELHAAECAACAQAIDDARALDRKLAPLFAAANPGPALEDRIIQVLPETRAVRTRSSFVFSRRMKIVLGAAAAVMLAFTGAGVMVLMEEQRIGFPMAQEGAGFKLGKDLVGGSVLTYEADTRKQIEGLAQGTAGRKPGRFVSGLTPADTLTPDLQIPIQSADDLAKEVREQTRSALIGGKQQGLAKLELGYAGDVDLARKKSEKEPGMDGASIAPPVNIPLPLSAASEAKNHAPASGPVASGGAAAMTPPVAGTAAATGMPGMPGPAAGGGPGGGFGLGANAYAPAGVPGMGNSAGRGGFKNGGGMGGGAGFGGGGLGGGGGSAAFYRESPQRSNAAKDTNGALALPTQNVFSYTDNRNLPTLPRQYFKPAEVLSVTAGLEKSDKDVKDLKKLADEVNKSKAESGQDRFGARRQLAVRQPPTPGNDSTAVAQGKQPKEQPGKTEPAQPPREGRRIIIRTGEIEFEIDSFDDAVSTVMKLINASKGGFIATINSDKLPNGKVTGSVVVRMPPEQLDKFLLDLRKELSKSGELKNQRLGSQDVTKQYTDLESRLRAARTMEERLLRIIKDGKGAIKDLLQAEKELGVWRTKIEEMEGEIRYYNNMASLATLTINLHEKNIRVAALITENERVQAGIEVEDVEKAHQDALKLIMDAKGRVTRSELKQHTAGQFNAILNFEVSPDAAGPMRDRLKQLGHMVRLQVDRIQGTENGGPAPKDGKIKRGDTQFMISIYNLANIAPRETVLLRLAVADVPAIYQKLRLAIAKAKGHVVNANLDEKDKLNINAQLDFDVRRLGEADILAALAAVGDTLSKQVTRVPDNDNVTDAKMLFRITLIDADSIQPRETVTQKLAVVDVPATYQKLKTALAKAKARVINAQINEADRRNITAVLDFSFKRADEGTLQAMLTTAGETLTRHVTRLPESASVTDAKVLAKVELVDLDAVQPRETLTVKIAATNVPAAYRKLKEGVSKLKPRVINTQLNEADRRNISAQFVFSVSRSDEGTMEELLAEAGETLSRQVSRLPENANVTDSKVLVNADLIDAEALPARETVVLKIATVDVPGTYQKLRDAVAKAKGRVAAAQLNEQDRRNVTATLNFDVPRKEETAVQTALSDAEALTRQVTRQPENISVTDTRVAFKIEMMAAAAITPRETTSLALEVTDVSNTLSVFNAEVKEVQGRVVQTTVGQERNGQVSARVIYDVPLSQAAGLVEKFKNAGHVRVHEVTRDPQAPEGKLALGRLVVTVSNTELLVPSDQGLWSQIRHGLAFSLRGLSISASWLIVGLLFVLPWLLLIYVVVWLVRRMIGGGSTPAPTSPSAPAG